MRRFVGVLLVCVLLAGCGGGNEDDKIAFASDRDGDYEILVMNADETGVTQLTYNNNSDTSPVWSPNGKQIEESIGETLRRVSGQRVQHCFRLRNGGPLVHLHVNKPAQRRSNPAHRIYFFGEAAAVWDDGGCFG